MSWYVLQCKTGHEEKIIRSCKQRLSTFALDDAFSFSCERLWRVEGQWKRMEKEMFPGYVFLESSHLDALSDELEEYRKILRVMEEPGYLISVYEEEERYLTELCGKEHRLELSYGYRDQENGTSYITAGPLEGRQNQIIKIDWHRRFAQIEIVLAKRTAVVWAGVDITKGLARVDSLIQNNPGSKKNTQSILVS